MEYYDVTSEDGSYSTVYISVFSSDISLAYESKELTITFSISGRLYPYSGI